MNTAAIFIFVCLAVGSHGQLKQIPQLQNYNPVAAWMEYSFDPVRRVCVFHGDNYKEHRYGDIFTRPESGKCFSYRCHYKGITIMKSVMGCEYGDQCIPKNGYIQEGCVNFTCGVIADFRQQKYIRAKSMFHLVNDGCEREGKCVPLGDTILVDNNCGAAVCSKTPSGSTANYYFAPSSDVCTDNDGCYPEGHIKPTGTCTGQRCIRKTSMVFEPRSSGCYADSICYAENSLRDTVDGNTCITEQCTLDNDFNHALVTTKLRCYYAGKCYNYNIVRRDRDNCQDFICEVKTGVGVWARLDAGCVTEAGECILPTLGNFNSTVQGDVSVGYECVRENIRQNATFRKIVTCKDENGDHPVGYVKQYRENCYEKICVADFKNVSQTPGTSYDGWVLRYYGCDWGGTNCALPGEAKREPKSDHCLVTYCTPNDAYTTPTYGLFPQKEIDSPRDKECKDDAGCQPRGYNKTHDTISCAVYRCDVISDPITGVTASFNTVYTGCLLNGACIPLGETRNTTTNNYCQVFRCESTTPVNNVMQPTSVQQGCWSKGRCYDTGSIINNDDCTDSVCEAGLSEPFDWRKGDVFQCKNDVGCHAFGATSFNNQTCYVEMCGQGGVWLNQNQGCTSDGKCVEPNTVINVDDCRVRVCANNKFLDQYKGCLTTNNQCVPANTEFYDNDTCTKYTCSQYPQPYGPSAGIAVATQECKVGGGCVAVGHHVIDKTTCKKTTCITSGSFQTDDWVCQDNEGCYDVGHSKKYTGMCEQYTCTQDGSVVTWKKSFWGCLTAGGCIPSGENRTLEEGLGCSTQSCILPTDMDAYIAANPSSPVSATSSNRGCWSEGTCYAPNRVKTMDRCRKERCTSVGGGFYTWQPDTTSNECYFNGRCYENGQQRKDNSTCAVVVCELDEWMPTGTVEGCVDNGACYSEGHALQMTEISECAFRVCLNGQWETRFKGCLGPVSKPCIKPNETYSDTSSCKTLHCPASTDSYETVPGLTTGDQKCKGDNPGDCYDIGYKSSLNTATCTQEICVTGGQWATVKTACGSSGDCAEIGTVRPATGRDPTCFGRRCRYETSNDPASSFPVPIWEFVQFGCVFGGTCMKFGSNITSKTGDETCDHVVCNVREKAWRDEDQATDLTQGVAQYQGCYFEDVCYSSGSIILDNKCSNITCVQTTPTENKWDRFTYYGCEYLGECFSPGVTWINPLKLRCTCYRGIGPVCL